MYTVSTCSTRSIIMDYNSKFTEYVYTCIGLRLKISPSEILFAKKTLQVVVKLKNAIK